MIYVLSLQQNKYYIGFTKNLQKTLTDHKYGYVNDWTNKYKMIEIVRIIDTFNFDKEDKYTKIYMDIYGINNVRGGSYSDIHLNVEQLKLLNKEIRIKNNTCFNCGKFGHYIKNCYIIVDENIKSYKENNENIKSYEENKEYIQSYEENKEYVIDIN